jgi:hypothetical protein
LIDWPAHGVPRLRLIRIWLALIRRHRFKIGPTVLHFVIFPPFAHILSPPDLLTERKRAVSGIVPGYGNFFGTFQPADALKG